MRAVVGAALTVALGAALTGCGGWGDGDGGEVTVDKRPGNGTSSPADSDPERRAADRDHPDLIPPGTYFYREDEASDLAMLRVRMSHGAAGADALYEERILLDSLTRARAALP